MAKSAGNLVLVSDLLRGYPPAAIRLLLLNRPWQTAWDTTMETSTRRPRIWRPCTPLQGGRTGPRTPPARSPRRCWTIWTFRQHSRSPGSTGEGPHAGSCTCWPCPNRAPRLPGVITSRVLPRGGRCGALAACDDAAHRAAPVPGVPAGGRSAVVDDRHCPGSGADAAGNGRSHVRHPTATAQGAAS